jgi:hypothetical protein
MRQVYIGIVAAVLSAVVVGYVAAAVWPGRQVEATVVGFAAGMVWMAYAWPWLVDNGVGADTPVLRSLGMTTPGCPAQGHQVDDKLGPRFTGRLMCWRPAGHRWHHYDKARQVYWSND